jgi:quercetin dioxygenase-like cupin family protein
VSLLARSLAELEPPAHVRARLLEAVAGPLRYQPHAPRVAELFGLSLADARDVLGRAAAPDAYTAGLWPGATVLRLPALAQAGSVIARIPPGLNIGSHGHLRRELTYVLDGELLEDEARTYRSGDALDMAPGSEHALRVVGSDHCLVVFALKSAAPR